MHISDKYVRDGKLTVKFGKVTGAFNARGIGLTSLEGCPSEVGGEFDCSENQLTSLKGAPKKVGGTFDCSDNELTSLENAPKEIGCRFVYAHNRPTSFFKSLEGLPRVIQEEFICEANRGVRGAIFCNPLRIVSIEVLQFLTTRNRFSDLIKQIHYIDWAEVSGSIYSYEQWIPKSSRIEHINMTPQQARELKALQLS